MRPLKVALVHRNAPRLMERRMVGWWSYPVPEFEIAHFPQKKGFYLATSDFRDYDVIFYEDGKLYGTFNRNREGPPVAYMVVDSTLSQEHYQRRYEQAKRNADLILVDWDRLERFADLGIPVRRLGYCVNDRLFYDRRLPRQYDIGSFQSHNEERLALGRHLETWAEQKGYTFSWGKRGQRGHPEEYPIAIASCKVNLNTNRNSQTRGHRVFDTMACRTCLLTNPTPDVSGEYRALNQHYLQYRNWDELKTILEFLIQSDAWSTFADAGHDLVQLHHTWAIRAAELRQTLNEVFGL